jgi:O-antigen/teichoic acid export membrane protein
MVIGYFTFFDFGIGRAITQQISEKLGKGRLDEIPGLFWTSITLMAGLGLIGGVLVFALSNWIVLDLLGLPDDLKQETLVSFWLLALGIPIVICSIGFRGALEAYQEFRLINYVRVPLGIANFVGPLAILPFNQTLPYMILVLILARLVALIVYIKLTLKFIPTSRINSIIDYKLVKPMLKFGGWLTVTNIVGPLMVYADRFFISYLLSIVAVTYYATPYEVVFKLTIIPLAISGVLFPALASAIVSSKKEALRYYDQGIRYIFLLMFPLAIVIVVLSQEILSLWLGGEFAEQSTFVMQLLVVGVFLNSFAQVPYALLHSVGRTDWTAMLHLVEVPIYFICLFYLINKLGINGAALAWLLRVLVDMVALFLLSNKTLNYFTSHYFKKMKIILLLSTFVLFVNLITFDGVTNYIILLFSLIAFLYASFKYVLEQDEILSIKRVIPFMHIRGSDE